MKLRSSKLIFWMLMLGSFSWAADREDSGVQGLDGIPERISARHLNLGEVHRIHLAQGLASVVQLPYPITEVKIGNPAEVRVEISKTLPSELTLVLKHGGAQPTNLIVRCGVRTFVFDVIPSKRTHQDLVRISGSYGAPEDHEMGMTLIDSSRAAGGKKLGGSVSDSEMVLIDSSRGAAGKVGGAP